MRQRRQSFMFKRPQRAKKTSEETCRVTKKRERNKEDYGSIVQLEQFT